MLARIKDFLAELHGEYSDPLYGSSRISGTKFAITFELIFWVLLIGGGLLAAFVQYLAS